MYVAKLEELKKMGDPIELRAAEERARPAACATLASVAAAFEAQAAPDDAHAHIDAQDLEKVRDECKAALDWLAEKTALQEKTAKTAPPVLLSADVVKKTEALKRVAEPILARPKPAPPKPEPTKVEEPMDTAEGDAAEPMETEGGAPEGDAPPAADDLD